MSVGFFVRGLVIGFSLAAPIGPIGMLCIRRTLDEGRAAGLVSGLGAATADATYGAIAAFGLTAVSGFLVAQKVWLGILGGAFLCYLGVRAFMRPPAEREAQTRESGLMPAYASTFALTLTNPMTILSFIPVFAGLGLGVSGDYASASATVFGVFTGSALWWLLLSTGVGMLRHRLGVSWVRVINQVSGATIFAFGFYAMLAAFRR